MYSSPSAGSRRGLVAIRDDGEGIPQTAIARLTERFYRVDVRRSRERGGTGLGLAIVKHIVSRHQGRLAIESKLGEGSVFTVFCPKADAEVSQRQPAPAGPPAGQPTSQPPGHPSGQPSGQPSGVTEML